jgi:hypothetical protein
MMDRNMVANGMKIKSMELEYIHGLMVESMKENGKEIIWKE